MTEVVSKGREKWWILPPYSLYHLVPFSSFIQRDRFSLGVSMYVASLLLWQQCRSTSEASLGTGLEEEGKKTHRDLTPTQSLAF